MAEHFYLANVYLPFDLSQIVNHLIAQAKGRATG
jgi:hypothetical protein